MRIKISDHGHSVILLVDEIMASDYNDAILLPKLGRKIMTGSLTRALFMQLLKEGWADLSEFETKRHSAEVLL